MTIRMLGALLLLLLGAVQSFGAVNPADYESTSQADLAADPEGWQSRKVWIEGTFLFTGSDFCYQIRKTKINTRDYLCFALGTPSLVRLYLKKDHRQAEELMSLKKGDKVKAFGTFDFVGSNYNFMIVDEITVEKTQ